MTTDWRHEIRKTFTQQSESKYALKLTSASQRMAKLTQLKEAIMKRKEALNEALWKDFHKPSVEAEITEFFPVITEINVALKNLPKWMRARKVKTPLELFGAKSELRYEPKGQVLIIGPWNYPFALIMNPLIGALSAGNAVILKPSELTPHVSSLIREIVEEVFPPSEVALFEGDKDVSTELLKLPFDHIFFTGSTQVGKVVMEAAAKNLTSVTLELGGKSPAVVDEDASIPEVTKRLLWGKFINAGQTCVAPDFVLIHEKKKEEFLNQIKKDLTHFYGTTEKERHDSPDLARVISARHFQRLKTLVDRSCALGAQVDIGGSFDEKECFISPTVLTNINPEMPIMGEEIFGPILPVLTYKDFEEAQRILKRYDRPLAFYLFTNNPITRERFLNNTWAGGACVNTTVVHLANPHLPFGGIGGSGQGNYHGFFSFRAFSHERSVLIQQNWSSLSLLFPPYNDKVKKMVALMSKMFAR